MTDTSGAYLNTLRESASRDDLLREIERHLEEKATLQKLGLVAFIEDLMTWQTDTFGTRQTLQGVLDHVVKEIETEIRPNPTDRKEWLGLMNLSVSALRLLGVGPTGLAVYWRQLLAELKARSWPDWRTADPDKAIEHDRGEIAEPANHRQPTVEDLAQHLHDEERELGYVWPEHPDDDGYRGNGSYVRITPKNIQARCREEAGRIWTLLGMPALLAEIEAGRTGAERVRELEAALKPFADVADYYDDAEEPDDFSVLADMGAAHVVGINKLKHFRKARAALRQAAQPAPTTTYPADFKWCQPDKRGQRRLMVTFEDPDQGIATFETEAEARSYFAQADIGWNCTLWAAMPLQPEAAQLAGRVEPFAFLYLNYRGEIGERRAIPMSVRFGATEWHPQAQWLLRAFDLEKQAEREFAMKDMLVAPPATPAACAPPDDGNDG